MAPIGKLYGSPGHGLIKRVLAVAKYGGVELEQAEYTHMQDNKKLEFTARFPQGKIPAFEGADGFLLTETTAIIKYIASFSSKSKQLLGADAKEQAIVEKFNSFIMSEVHTHNVNVLSVTRGVIPFNKPTYTFFIESQARALATLEQHLAFRTYLVTERITVSDILLASALQWAFGSTLGEAERKKYPSLVRFFDTLSNTPGIKEVFGETEYTEKPIQYVPPAKEKKPAAEKPKAEPKPKAEKKKEPEPEDEDIDLVPKEEPKAKNPLDSLPKSDFNLEDWKRSYSNMETRGPGGAIEWFYSKFDPAGFSVWSVNFKYNEELTQVFMSSNQIGGFFNRLEASRKYLFGSVGVLGSANNSVIAGVIICRGTDYKPVVDCAPDWESYDFKAIDLKNEEQKKFFEGALAWDLEVDGKAWADGKNFK